MRCPRCSLESLPAAAYCGGCGAPIRLGEEGPPGRLDATLDLDRRAGQDARRSRPDGGLPEAAPIFAEAAPRPALGGLPLALERSQWDLRALGGAEPVLPPEYEALPEPDVDVLEIHVERGESWRRVAAWAVDALPFVAAGAALGRTLLRAASPAAAGEGVAALLDLVAREQVIVLSLSAAVTIALYVYTTLAHALAGATLGKRLLRLRVVGPDGARPSPARAALRSAFAVVSAALLGLGFLLALFTRSGRGLHDVCARTWVVKAP